MTADEFREALRRLDLGQQEFARLERLDRRRVRRWARGHELIPEWLAERISAMTSESEIPG